MKDSREQTDIPGLEKKNPQQEFSFRDFSRLESIAFEIVHIHSGTLKEDDYLTFVLSLFALKKAVETKDYQNEFHFKYHEVDEIFNFEGKTNELVDFMNAFLGINSLDHLTDYLHKDQNKTDSILDGFTISSFTNEEIFTFTQNFILNFRSRSSVRDFYSPEEVIDIAIGVLKPQEGESIFNPACGISSFFFKNSIRGIKNEYTGIEINNYICNLNKIFAYMYGVYNWQNSILNEDILNVDLPITNSYYDFNDEDGKSLPRDLCSIHPEKYDMAFSVPPFGSRISEKKRISNTAKGKYKHYTLDLIILEKMINSLNDNGRMAIVLPGKILDISEGIIIDLINQDLVRGIITFGNDLFYNKVKTFMLIIENKKETAIKGGFQVINYFEQSTSEIIDDFSNLAVNKYSQVIDNGALDKINIRYLADLIIFNTQRDLSKDQNAVSMSSIININRCKEIKGKDKNNQSILLKNDGFTKARNPDYSIEVEQIESSYIDPSKSYKVVPENAVIGNYRLENPIWVKDLHGKELLVDHNVPVLVPDLKIIEPQFLAYLLENDEILQAQIKSYSRGARFPQITRRAFDEILLPLPNIDEQKKIFDNFKDKLIKEEGDRYKQFLRKLRVEHNDQELSIVSTIRHDISNKLGTLRNDFIALDNYLNVHELLEDAITEPLSDDDDVENVATVLSRLHKKIGLMQGVLDSTKKVLELRIEEKDFEECKLKAFLMKNLPQPSPEENYQLKIDGVNPLLKIATKAFLNMMDNYIINAKKHGFIENGDNRFDISIEENQDYVTLICFNSGRPFPLNELSLEDFKGLYVKSQFSEGSGIGGHFIYKVLRSHNANLDIKSGISGTEFIMKFPKG
ncbi:MAG: N-6 DNA methylase [Lentisphaeria bacterium]|nr:N-6 DNA methylase [Lentisphaeria bacterium]